MVRPRFPPRYLPHFKEFATPSNKLPLSGHRQILIKILTPSGYYIFDLDLKVRIAVPLSVSGVCVKGNSTWHSGKAILIKMSLIIGNHLYSCGFTCDNFFRRCDKGRFGRELWDKKLSFGTWQPTPVFYFIA